MENSTSEALSIAKQFRSFAPYVEPFILGGIMTLIGLGVIPYNTNWVKITIVGAGVQLLTASVLGVRIRGLITPEIKNIQCPNCHGYFTSTNLVCQKCGTTMEIPSS